MAAFTPDTSCMVAALTVGHEHQERALAALGRLLDRGDLMILAAHTLLETYSVMTRRPPLRATPTDARIAIQDSFLSQGTVVALTNEQYVELLGDLAARGIAGGRVYDAAIVACAKAAGVDQIVTFNEVHFRPLAGAELTVLVP